jgi:hypothetical protein
MTDIDLIANLDKATGLPEVDHRSPAQRWLGAMHHGPEQHGTAHLHLTPPPPFGQVGADPTKNPTKAAPTAAQQKKEQNNMSNKHNRDLFEASKLNNQTIERLLLQHGFPAEIEGTWVHAKMHHYDLFFNITDHIPLVDLAGAIGLRQGISLKKSLRFLNHLNNATPLVRFTFGEAITPCDDEIDLTDLWGNVALPIRAGFSSKQFIEALDLLFRGLDYAQAAAVEAGFVEAPHVGWPCCCEQREGVGHGL